MSHRLTDSSLPLSLSLPPPPPGIWKAAVFFRFRAEHCTKANSCVKLAFHHTSSSWYFFLISSLFKTISPVLWVDILTLSFTSLKFTYLLIFFIQQIYIQYLLYVLPIGKVMEVPLNSFKSFRVGRGVGGMKKE